MTPSREVALQLAHIRIHARTWGDASLPPLLALHGWLDNANSFDALAPWLADRFYVVALDLPGHGLSEHRAPGSRYHFVDYLDDVLGAADQLGWSRFALLGHSLGGGIASVLAAACPQRVAQLFLIEALGPVAGVAEHSLTQVQRAMQQRSALGQKALRVFADVEAAARARERGGELSAYAARILVARGLRPVDGGFSWSSDARLTLASPQRFIEAQVRAILKGIEAPVHLTLADPAPAFLPRETIRERIACVDDIEVLHLPGSHHLHLENPQPLALAMLDFVSRKRVSDGAGLNPGSAD